MNRRDRKAFARVLPLEKTSRVFRIQDREGRGPFRPGFSDTWLDKDIGNRVSLPTWMEEFGMDSAREAALRGMTVFSAVRDINQIGNWFTATERQRLYSFGYYLVEVPHARVLHESVNQVLCARDLPLTFGVMNRRPI